MPWIKIENWSPQLRKYVVTFSLILLWFIVSTIKGSSAKWISKKFDYPFTLSMSHLVSTTVYSFPLLYFMKLRNIPVSSWKQFLWFIIPMGILKTLSTVTGHLAVWNVSVPYNQTIRATSPIFTVILSRLFLNIRQSYPVYLSLVPVVLGVGIASYTESAFSLFGMLLGIAATCSGSVQNVVNKELMSTEGAEEIHTFELLAIITRLACFMFLPIWATIDGPKLFEWVQGSKFNDEYSYLFLVAGDASLNFIQALLAFSVLNCVIATTYSVANAAKRGFIIIAGIIIFSKPVTILNGVGMAMTILGVFLYSYFSIQDEKQEELEAEKKTTLNSINLNNVELSTVTRS